MIGLQNKHFVKTMAQSLFYYTLYVQLVATRGGTDMFLYREITKSYLETRKNSTVMF